MALGPADALAPEAEGLLVSSVQQTLWRVVDRAQLHVYLAAQVLRTIMGVMEPRAKAGVPAWEGFLQS